MVLKWWGSLTSKLDGYPVTSEPHLWWQACPWRKSLSRKIALTRIKFYGRKLQVKAFLAFGKMQGCADFMRFGAILCPGNFRHGQALPCRLSLRATMERKPVHDFLLPFIHWRSQDCTKWNNKSNPRKISIEPLNCLIVLVGQWELRDITRKLETFAREHGYKRTVLMTRERMDYAIKLYEGLGYKRIENYPPYQHMDDAVCYANDLPAISLTV